jgi:hypothetical protein
MMNGAGGQQQTHKGVLNQIFRRKAAMQTRAQPPQQPATVILIEISHPDGR